MINASWDMLPTDIGAQLGEKIADILQGKVPVPTKTQVFDMGDRTEWNSKNAAEWKPYDKRVKSPGLQHSDRPLRRGGGMALPSRRRRQQGGRRPPAAIAAPQQGKVDQIALVAINGDEAALLGGQAAVDGERLAHDEGRIVGSEKQDGAGDLFRLRDPADRMA